ncbi:hypothetical protein N7509_010281 [Penicillium cosmopolitanum]|uniref:Alpha/beta hydrolase fold-3 domain-containing protein n=1 Tax=Penicillium cosmopolitanum TaxID=1131564 RepID=A0A9X0B4G2_9EURO|nr:uncharacterized protein N7509_010281 [Penicillium cosmopolitanum]KAJ5387740.1 hypothetical protein N7509_010281 [Penicillium cosmopolitanum]
MRALISYSCRRAFRLRRPYSASVVHFQRSRFFASYADETVSLPVGNNGLINLRITRPSLLGQDTTAGSNNIGANVILYLPPGPLFRAGGEHSAPDSERAAQNRENKARITKEISPQHVLASVTAATVVTVEYRLGNIGEEDARGSMASPKSPPPGSPNLVSTGEMGSSFYQYPTPFHDAITGFDWIQDNLRPTQLGVFGSHIGGSLALMLALTEAEKVNAVAAAAPICDWPGLDEYCLGNAETIDGPRKSSKKKASKAVAPPDLVPLLDARKQLFSSFERCFDAFASPILFLRSAGRDVPKAFPQYLTGPEYPIPVLQETRVATMERYGAADTSIWERNIYPTDEESNEIELPTRRRKALSRWPPYGLDYGSSGNTWSQPGHGVRRLEVTLPWVRVYSGNKRYLLHNSEESAPTVLAQQSEEMVSVLRRACFFGREKGYGERRVTLSHANESPEHEAAHWLGNVFDGSLKDD